jgi:hypothetical protein
MKTHLVAFALVTLVVLMASACQRERLMFSGATSVLSKEWRNDLLAGNTTKQDVFERLGKPSGPEFLNGNGDKAVDYSGSATLMKEWSYDPMHKLIFYTHMTTYDYGVTFSFDEHGEIKNIEERGKLAE